MKGEDVPRATEIARRLNQMVDEIKLFGPLWTAKIEEAGTLIATVAAEIQFRIDAGNTGPAETVPAARLAQAGGSAAGAELDKVMLPFRRWEAEFNSLSAELTTILSQ